jgi:endonuclease/exonuclease/phosphatase family metal-dependent hydrolase
MKGRSDVAESNAIEYGGPLIFSTLAIWRFFLRGSAVIRRRATRNSRRNRIAIGIGAGIAAALGSLVPLRAGHAGLNYVSSGGPRYAGGPSVEASDPTPDELIVVTFNIRDADLIALQEMDEAGVSQLAESLGFHWVYYPAAVHPRAGARGTGGDFGNAILARWPITSDYKLLLPGHSFPGDLQRIAVAADVAAPAGPIRLYSVHLETPFAMLPANRAAQISAILQDAAGSPTRAIIVAGDFNGRGAVGRAFTSRGFDWPTRNATRTVSAFAWDHVFARDLPEGPTAGVGRVMLGASDHRPVWARWRLH